MIINKDITGIVIEYLSIKEKIILGKISKIFNDYIINELGKLYYLINDINKIKASDVVGEFILPYNNDCYKLFENYNNGKIIRIDDAYWYGFEKQINKLKYDEKVEGIFIDDLDRGVGDWEVLDNILRKKYPNYKNICLQQMFGVDNLSESKCELIFLFTDGEVEVDLDNLIYKKIFYHPYYEDYINYPELKAFVNVLNVNGQIQVIIGDDVESMEK